MDSQMILSILAIVGTIGFIVWNKLDKVIVILTGIMLLILIRIVHYNFSFMGIKTNFNSLALLLAILAIYKMFWVGRKVSFTVLNLEKETGSMRNIKQDTVLIMNQDEHRLYENILKEKNINFNKDRALLIARFQDKELNSGLKIIDIRVIGSRLFLSVSGEHLTNFSQNEKGEISPWAAVVELDKKDLISNMDVKIEKNKFMGSK